jgi:hypothetical protein
MNILIRKVVFIWLLLRNNYDRLSKKMISRMCDIYNLLKDSFKDMMQEMLEAVMDVSLSYPKNEKGKFVG